MIYDTILALLRPFCVLISTRKDYFMMYEDYYVTQKKERLNALIKANGVDFSVWNMSDHTEFYKIAKELRHLRIIPKKIWKFYKSEYKWHEFEFFLNFLEPYLISVLTLPFKLIIHLIELAHEKLERGK